MRARNAGESVSQCRRVAEASARSSESFTAEPNSRTALPNGTVEQCFRVERFSIRVEGVKSNRIVDHLLCLGCQASWTLPVLATQYFPITNNNRSDEQSNWPNEGALSPNAGTLPGLRRSQCAPLAAHTRVYALAFSRQSEERASPGTSSRVFLPIQPAIQAVSLSS